MSTGEKIETASDFATGGSSPFKITRAYRSHNLDFGMIGSKWRLPWDSLIQSDGTSYVRALRADGSAFYFNNGSVAGTWNLQAVSAWDVKLTSVTTPVPTFFFTDEDDTVEQYQQIVGVWRLVSIAKLSGYTQTLSYTAEGLLATVSDNVGRTFTMTYEAAPAAPNPTNWRVITRISGPGGIQIDYLYQRTTTTVTPFTQDLSSAMLISVTVSNPSAGTPAETTTYQYENTNDISLLTGITDSRSVRYATFAYDSLKRVTSSVHVGGADGYSFVYDNINNTTTTTNSLGKSETIQFTNVAGRPRSTSSNGIASTSCPASSKFVTYDVNGRITQTTDEEGRVTSYVLDGRGQPTTVTRGFGTPAAVAVNYTYHPTLHLPTQMVEPGKTTNYSWDTSNRLSQLSLIDTTTTTVPYATNGQTRTTTYTYVTAAGLLASVDGPLAGTGDKVSYTYDANGYVKTVTNQVGHVTTVNTLNARGQPTQITDPNGVISNLTYDFQGRLLTVTVNPGATQAVTTMTYDAIGQITKITRPDNSFLTYVYDAARRLTSTTNTTGETMTYTYDLMGNITSRVIKSTTGTTTFNQTATYDELGRLLKNIGAYNQTTAFGYERNDNLKSVTDPRSGLYSYGYDSLNRLITQTDQENSTVTLTRDGQDNPVAYSDPRTLVTTYVRNGFGEIIRQSSPDSGITDTVRDARGLPTQVTDGRGIVTAMTYDAASRMLTKTYPAAVAENVTYTYDDITAPNKGKGRLTKVADQSGSIAMVYDERGNVVKETRIVGGKTYVVSYVYDLADRVVQITYPSGRIVTYTRDTTGRIVGAATKLNATAASVTLTSGVIYQPLSNLVQSMTYGNGLNDWNTHTLDYELDLAGVYNGAAKVIERAHTRTDALNLTNIWDNVTAANNQSCTYSPANRLSGATGLFGSKSFSYDGVGNRTQEITVPLTGATTSDVFGYPTDKNRVPLHCL